MLLRSVARVGSILSVWTRAVSTSMSEVNLDKCLEAAIEVAKRAGKVNMIQYNLTCDLPALEEWW